MSYEWNLLRIVTKVWEMEILKNCFIPRCSVQANDVLNFSGLALFQECSHHTNAKKIERHSSVPSRRWQLWNPVWLGIRRIPCRNPYNYIISGWYHPLYKLYTVCITRLNWTPLWWLLSVDWSGTRGPDLGNSVFSSLTCSTLTAKHWTKKDGTRLARFAN